MDKERFLQRWARLKSEGEAQAPQTTGLTLEDVARLTPDSDYAVFFAQGVDKAVRRMALKKLFSDPHFNLPDGLDIYMGDYSQASPVSASMLAALQQAQGFLQQVADTVKQAGSAQGEGDDRLAAGRPQQQLADGKS